MKILDIIPNYKYELSELIDDKDMEKEWKNFVLKAKFKTPFRKFFITFDEEMYKKYNDSEDEISVEEHLKLMKQIVSFIDKKYKDLGFDYSSLSNKILKSGYWSEYVNNKDNRVYFEIIDVPEYISNNYKG